MSIGSCHSAPDTDTDAFDIFWLWIILSPFAVLFRFGALNCCQEPFLSISLQVIFGNFLIRKATVWKPDLVYLTKVLSLTCSFMVLCFVSLFMMSFVPWRNERNDRSRVQSDHRSFGSGWDGVSKIQSWRCSSSATAFWILNVRNHVRMISCSFKAPPL